MKNLLKSLNMKNPLVIILFIVILSIILYKLLNKSSFNTKEQYINKDCRTNTNFSNINSTRFSLKSDGLYGCSNGNYLHFYINSESGGVSNVLQDISYSSAEDDINVCGVKVITDNKDLFIYNPDKSTTEQCLVANIDYQKSPTENSVLYIDCSSGNSNISGYEYLGKGLITEMGFQRMIDSNFRKIAEVNKYCLDDNLITQDFTELQKCLSDAKSGESNISVVGDCFRTHGSSIIQEISGNYADTWTNFKPFKINDHANGLNLADGELRTSEYINDFFNDDWTVTDSSANAFNKQITDYETTSAELDETKLDYTSTFMLYIFLTIVLVIAVILAILTMTNPDIVSAEMVIGYVIFISLITYFLYGRQKVEKNISNQLFKGENMVSNVLSKFAL